MSETTELGDEYLSVDAEGIPVEQRMPSGKAMRTLLEECIQNDSTAASYRASIQGLVNGNKPFNEKARKDAGQSDRSNWNDRQAESVIDAKCTAEFNMLFDVSRLIEVDFQPGFILDRRVAQMYASKIAQAYTYVLRRDPRVSEAAQRAIRDRVELGLGFLVFPDKYDWRPKAIRRGRCFFNESASADCSDIEFFMALDSLTIAEAYAHIHDEARAEDSGWFVDRLKRALVDFFYIGGQRARFNDNYVLMMEDLERRIRSNDPYYYSKQYSTFPVVHGFFQERSGKVSQYMIAYSANSDAWLFESYEAFSEMSALVIPLPYDYGEGTLNSVKGLGHRIYAILMESLRTLMHTLDSAKLASSFILSNRGGAASVNYAVYRNGPTSILGQGFEPIQTSFAPNLEPSFAIREMLQRIANNNNGIMRIQQENVMASESQKTAEQVRVEASRDVKTENDRAFLTYLRWDEIHNQMFRRIISTDARSSAAPKKAREAAKLFWETCESLGVPMELFTKYSDKLRISATRAIGAGSPYTKQQSLRAMKADTFASMSERGRRLIDQDLASIYVGQDNVGKYFDDPDMPAVPSDETSDATMETNFFKLGMETLVGIDQLHMTHVDVHLAAIMQTIQQFQQDPMSIKPEEAASLMEQGIPHTLRHIDYLALEQFREPQVEQYRKLIAEQVIPIAQQIVQMAVQIRQAQDQEREAMMQENMQLKQQYSKENMAHQREMAKVQGLLDVERIKAEGLNDARMLKQQQQMELRTQGFVQDSQLKSARAQQDLTEKYAKLQADMQKQALEIETMRRKLGGANETRSE